MQKKAVNVLYGQTGRRDSGKPRTRTSEPQVNIPRRRTHADTKSNTSPKLVVCVSSMISTTPIGICVCGSSCGSCVNTGKARDDCTKQSIAMARRKYSVGR